MLSDMEGLRYGEIAETLQIPVGTVKSRLFRARRQLQAALYAYAVEIGIHHARGRRTMGEPIDCRRGARAACTTI